MQTRVLLFSLAFLMVSCGKPTPAEELCLASTEQGIVKVCQGPVVVTGPDVSYYQSTVTWSSVKAAGHVFAITRASDGATYRDSKFDANWRGIKSAGLVRGVYQFFRPAQDPTAQANLLVSMVNASGGFQPGDLPPVLDVETTDGVSSTVIRQRMQIWLDRIEKLTNKRPLIYTAAFMNSVVGTGFRKYPLWVANYGTTCPLVPDSWSTWKMWQYTSTGSITGISGNVDTNRFNGTLAALKQFASTVVDAGSPVVADAGHPIADAGHPVADAGHPVADAGHPVADAGHPVADAGHVPDAGSEPADAGSLDPLDAGPDEPLPDPMAGFDAGSEGAVLGSGEAAFIGGCLPVTGTGP